MCGFTGFLTQELAGADLRAVADRMNTQLRHRGPDASGIWADAEAGIALAHRRLSILDLSEAGAQPMQSPSGRFQLAYNGEIYNHLELRDALEAKDTYSWRGHSDTETLLACIEAWGLEETLHKAKGMFALALWDRKQRSLCLARDRLGEKPLYYGWSGRTFLFGSELKALCAFPGFENQINRQALAHFMRFMYVPAPLSIYQNIFKLEPGCVLTLDDSATDQSVDTALRPGERRGAVSVEKWYDLRKVAAAGLESLIDDPKVARKQLENALRQAVSRQSLADVPLGAFLSGGVDSSLIVALMQDQSETPVNSFTIAFEDPAYNEAPFAGAVAAHLGTCHSEMAVTASDVRNVIPNLPSIYDEPFADSSQIPTFLVCQAAKRDVTVALSGDAGDELFAGYNRYFWGPSIWGVAGKMPSPLRSALANTALAVPPSVWRTVGAVSGRMLSAAGGVARLDEKVTKLAERVGDVRSLDEFYIRLVSEWQNPGRVVEHAHMTSGALPPLMMERLPNVVTENPIAQMMLRDSLTYLPDDILCKVDRAAMAVSLETRVPFLDPDVVELAWKIPTSMKVNGRAGKSILREILYDYVPKHLIERPKTGFGIPVGQWLRGTLRDWAESLLDEKRLRDEGFFAVDEVRRVWNYHLTGKADHTARLWSVLMFQAWNERRLK